MTRMQMRYWTGSWLQDKVRLMSQRERETEFLRQCLSYDDSAERHKLEQSIDQAQRNERCVPRAIGLMAVLTLIGMAGLCYAAIFLDSNQNILQLITPPIIKLSFALGFGSLVCFLAFVGLSMLYRRELEKRWEECRRLAAKLFESRLGKAPAMPLPGIRKEKELIVNHNKPAVRLSELSAPNEEHHEKNGH